MRDALYRWRWKASHPDRFGQLCRVEPGRTSAGQVTVVFEDGERVSASRMALQRAYAEPGKEVARG